jgi:hypothetical protein
MHQPWTSVENYQIVIVNPLVNVNQLLWTMNCFILSETRLLYNEIQIYQTIHLLIN